MPCSECGDGMHAFPICDVPPGVKLEPNQRWVKVSAVIYHCPNCGHQTEEAIE